MRAWVRGWRGVYVLVLKYKLEFPVGNGALLPSCNSAWTVAPSSLTCHVAGKTATAGLRTLTAAVMGEEGEALIRKGKKIILQVNPSSAKRPRIRQERVRTDPIRD